MAAGHISENTLYNGINGASASVTLETRYYLLVRSPKIRHMYFVQLALA